MRFLPLPNSDVHMVDPVLPEEDSKSKQRASRPSIFQKVEHGNTDPER